jgi:hypothetical protein
LRQGCPLSPLLYIIMVEASERVVGSLAEIKLIIGVKSMNHYQFADDALLLGGASTIITKHFKCILDHFLNASRCKVNNGESQIYGWNIKSQLLHAISKILSFPRPPSSIWECRYLSQQSLSTVLAKYNQQDQVQIPIVGIPVVELSRQSGSHQIGVNNSPDLPMFYHVSSN